GIFRALNRLAPQSVNLLISKNPPAATWPWRIVARDAELDGGCSSFRQRCIMRRLVQFRMSTLLLLVTLCAVALAWWRDRRDLHRRLHDTEQKLRDAELFREAMVLGEKEFNKPIVGSAEIHFRRPNLAEGQPLPVVLELLTDVRSEVRLDAIYALLDVA